MEWDPDLNKKLLDTFSQDSTVLQHIFDSFPEVIILADEDRNIMAANDATKSMLGYSPSELVGSPVKRIYANTDEYGRVGEVIAREQDKDRSNKVQEKTG